MGRVPKHPHGRFVLVPHIEGQACQLPSVDLGDDGGMLAGRARGLIATCAAAWIAVAVFAGCSSSVSTDRSKARTRPLELSAGAPSKASSPVAATRGPLAAGTYYTSQMTPTVTFTVGSGWTVFTEGQGDFGLYMGARDQINSYLEVDFTSLRHGVDVGVLDPPFLGARDETVEQLAARTKPVPANLEGYLRGLGYLQVSPAQPARMGGLSGVMFDVGVGSIADQPACQPNPAKCDFSLFNEPARGSPFADPAGLGIHLWLLQANDGPLVVTADALDPALLAAQNPTIDALLASVHFG
jgi:hypothetical protein